MPLKSDKDRAWSSWSVCVLIMRLLVVVYRLVVVCVCVCVCGLVCV